MSNDLLTRLQAAKTDEEREWVVLEFSLQNLEAEIKDAVWAAAIPHWFDESFLAALLDVTPKKVSTIYKRVQNLSFIEVFASRGQNVHERTRKLLLKHLWENDRDRYQKISSKAADYCSRQNQEDVSWRVEWIYNLLIGNPEDAAYQIQIVGWDWNNSPKFAYESVEAMVRAAMEHASAERLTPRCLGWVKFFDALVDMDYFRYASARGKFEELQAMETGDRHLQIEVNYRLGDTYTLFAEYGKAREAFNRALPICRETGYRQGEANCLSMLGKLFLNSFEFDKAQKHLEDAVSIYKKVNDRLGEALCYYELGNLHRQKNDLKTARRYYEQSLGISGEINSLITQGNSLMMIGFVDKLSGKNDSAVDYFERAVQIHRVTGNRISETSCLLYLGDIDQTREQYAEARKKFETALRFYEHENMRYDVGITLWRLADVALDEGDKKSARANYSKAYKIFTEIGSDKYAGDVKQSLDKL